MPIEFWQFRSQKRCGSVSEISLCLPERAVNPTALVDPLSLAQIVNCPANLQEHQTQKDGCARAWRRRISSCLLSVLVDLLVDADLVQYALDGLHRQCHVLIDPSLC